jgi:tRNA(His) 5'-end guanylyltransferase
MSDIYEILQTAHEQKFSGLYERPVYVEKEQWTNLGNLISNREKLNENISNEKCYTLRLDIKGMSNIKKLLFSSGIFQSKYDISFEEMMKHTTKLLQVEYNAKWAYTQSDEITLVICPSIDNPLFQHHFGGRHDKLVSLSAAFASIESMKYLMLLNPSKIDVILHNVNILFDSRLAVWDNQRDAFQVILWRAYDCGINGISDTIHNLDNKKSRNLLQTSPEGISTLIKQSTGEKLNYLNIEGLLPLRNHQAYGTLFQREKKLRKGFNPKTLLEVECIRSVIEHISDGNIINKIKNGDIVIQEKLSDL